MRTTLLVLVVAGLSACAGESSSGGGAHDAEPSDVGPAVDAGADVAAEDAGVGADTAGDAATLEDADAGALDAGDDVAADAGADAADEDTAAPPGECGSPTLPSWAVAADEGRLLVATCEALTLRVTVMAPGVVRLVYDRGAAPHASWAVLAAPDATVAASVGAVEGGVRLCTAALNVDIAEAGCRVHIADPEGATMIDEPAGGGSVAGDKPALRRLTPPGERFYGFGERTGPLDKRGLVMTSWATDAYDSALGGWKPTADPLYQAIPFFVGLRDGKAYGVLTDVTSSLRFDMAAAEPDVWEVRADVGPMVQHVIAGPGFAEVLDRYTALTGRPALPPRWALGYHQSRWGWWPDDRVREIAERFRSEQLPADALWLDIQHMDGFRSWTWDPVGFPDPGALVADLKALGFRTVAIVDPAIKVDPAWDIYSQGVAGGHFIPGAGGAPYVGTVWPGDAVFPDFTRPATRAWWAGLVPRATQHGVGGLWIDMNEPASFQPEHGNTLPNDLVVDGDGQPVTMAEAHNVYALQEARATFEGLATALPGERPFVLSRSGYAGIQRYAAVWTGDAPSTWVSLHQTMPMLLGLGLSGVPMVGSDVGGYSGGASPELFARWLAVGAASPFFRGHVTDGAPDQEPWAFGTEVRDIARERMSERYELLPTWYSLLHEAATTGAPPLRPLVWEYPGDLALQTIDDQAMIGPHLMIAPVLSEAAATRAVVFPPGRWFELRSGAIVEGPVTRTVNVTLAALPMWAREGAIIARGPAMQWSDAAPVDPLTLDCYPAVAAGDLTLFEDDGLTPAWQTAGSTVTWTVQRTPTGATLTAGPRDGAWVPPARRVLARLRRVDQPPSSVSIDGQAVAQSTLDAVTATGAGWAWDPADRSVLVGLPGSAALSLTVTYDTSIPDPAPPVDMPFTVVLPPDTPPGSAIYMATDFGGWTHTAVATGGPGDTVAFTVAVPRGEWFHYKLTRGGWETVEKWPGCQEATNRYAFGAAHPVKADTVWGWSDTCVP